MSDQPTVTPAIPDGDMQRVMMRGLALMEIVKGDTDPVALDALLNAYVNTARTRGVLQSTAQIMMGVAQQLGAVPVQRPPVPSVPIDRDDTASVADAIRALCTRLADLLQDQHSRIAMSALLTMYMHIASTTGETVAAAAHLVKTGESALAERASAPADANVPAPPGPILH